MALFSPAPLQILLPLWSTGFLRDMHSTRLPLHMFWSPNAVTKAPTMNGVSGAQLKCSPEQVPDARLGTLVKNLESQPLRGRTAVFLE